MKRILVGAGITLGIVAAGVVAYGLLFRAQPETPVWTVASYSGAAEASVQGGDWAQVTMKMKLSGSDRVRTGDDGEITLVHGESHVAVQSRTEMHVADLGRDVSRFQVAEGTVYVEARQDRVVMKTVAGATVDATEAGLGMTVKPDGYVKVQVKRGGADFSSMGRTEHLAEGQESEARAGRPPTKPVAIPAALLLNVRFPDAETFNARLARIEGTADPASRIRIGGRHVPVDSEGRFTVDVALEEGINQIEVDATDSIGRERTERSNPIHVDTMAPGLSGVSIGTRSVATGG